MFIELLKSVLLVMLLCAFMTSCSEEEKKEVPKIRKGESQEKQKKERLSFPLKKKEKPIPFKTKKLSTKESDEESVKELIKMLSHKSASIRQQAVYAFSKITLPPKKAIPAFIEALSDEDYWVKLSIVRILGKLGSSAKAAVPALLQLLQREHQWIQMIEKEDSKFKANIGSSSQIEIGKHLRLRHEVAKTLQKIGLTSGRQVEQLLKIILELREEKTDQICEETFDVMIQLVKNMKREALSSLITALKHKDYKIRFWAIKLVGELKIPSKQAIHDLLKMLKNSDPKMRREILIALYNLGVKDFDSKWLKDTKKK